MLNDRLAQILEASFALIMMYLILSNASGFSNIIRTTIGGYVDAVVALQGRG